MIVLDASAAIELVLGLPGSSAVNREVELANWHLLAPELLPIEVVQVLRRRERQGNSTTAEVTQALQIFEQFPIQYFDHRVVVPRVWELRENFSAYDAAYVALAEITDAELVTMDGRLANAPGHGARISLIR